MPSSRAALLAAGFALLAGVAAAAPSGDEAAILALRAGSNAAIARHDAEAAVSIFLADGTYVLGSGGGLVQGREAMRAAFGQSFADPQFVTYVREPVTVTVGGDTAAEEGRWRGIWKGREIGGRFLARWSRTADGWRIRSEMYVPLY